MARRQSSSSRSGYTAKRMKRGADGKMYPAKSGAAKGVDKNGKEYVRAWNASKGMGLITVFAAPYHATAEHQSRAGRVWSNWIAKVFWRNSGQEKIYPVLVDSSGKFVIEQLGMIVNPSKDYFGKWSR